MGAEWWGGELVIKPFMPLPISPAVKAAHNIETDLFLGLISISVL